MFSTWPFVRSCFKTCEHGILKMNELILLQIGISGPQGKGAKRSTLGVKGQGHVTPKLNFETLQRHHSQHLWSNVFSSLQAASTVYWSLCLIELTG